MLDWYSLLANALWVIGLALLLAVFSFAMYRARANGIRLSAVLGAPDLLALALVGLALFSYGRALSSVWRWWEAGLWLLLALLFSYQAWAVQRSRNPAAAQNPASPFRRDGPLVIGLLVLGLVLASLYGMVIRPWMQPDEPRHFEVTMHVARLGQPVVTGKDRVPDWESEIIAAMDEESFWWYGFSLIGWDPANLPDSFQEVWGPMYSTAFFQPPLYYTLTGGLMTLFPDTTPLAQIVFWLRFVSVFLLALSLAGIYFSASELFPDRSRMALAVLALAALWPSHLAASAAVNNDGLVEVFTVWTIYFAIRLLRRGPDLSTISWMLALSLLAMSSKRTGLAALGIAALALALWGIGYLRERPRGRSRRLGFVILIGSLAVVVILGAVALSSGRLGIPRTFMEDLTTGVYWQSLAQAPYGAFGDALLRTLIGWFGWMRIGVPTVVLWAGGILLVFSLLGMILGPRRDIIRNLAAWQKRALLLFLLVFLLQLFLIAGKELIYGTWRDGSLPQARYLYPIFPALAIPVVLGLRAWTPDRFRVWALPGGILLLLGYNIYILAFVLYPFFWL